MVNHLLTITIKVTVLPTARSQFDKQGTNDEEDSTYPRLLELASRLGLEQRWQRRLRRLGLAEKPGS